jgi:comEA protein
MTMNIKWLGLLLCGLWICESSELHAQNPDEKCREEVSADAQDPLLDLNHATLPELEKLPGIGPAKAQAIVAFRDARGGFTSVNQLLRIKGIGRAMLRKLAPLVTVSRTTQPGAANRVR